MKIITILSLCVTASLSFTHSTLSYGERGDAFAYDDSGLCADIPNCYPSMKNLPEIDDNSKFPPMPQRIGNSVATYGASWSDFEFVIVGADGRQIINSKKKIDEYEAIYNKYSNLGFSSEADANAYFNVYILNNTPSNQLGYLRWLTYEFSDSIKSYMINFGATTTEHLAPPLFPLYKTPNDTTDNTFTYKYLWLCNDVINCQFIKLSDMCDTSPKTQTPLRFPYGSYYSPEKINHDCEMFLSFQRALPGFSSEADANINIQLFDSSVLLKEKQNYPTNIKHDF